MEFIRRCHSDVFAGQQPAGPVPPDLERLMPGQFSKQAFDDWDPGMRGFQFMAYYQTNRIRTALKSLSREQVHALSYEDLTSDPVTAFEGVANFLELPDPEEWARRVAKLVILR